MSYLAVFIGGGLGALMRFGIAKALAHNNTFPWATFIANFLSCVILGMLISFFLSKPENKNLYLLAVTGFCGGFSTFSTFSLESFQLLENGHTFMALLYMLSSILVCLIALYVGIKVCNFS